MVRWLAGGEAATAQPAAVADSRAGTAMQPRTTRRRLRCGRPGHHVRPWPDVRGWAMMACRIRISRGGVASSGPAIVVPASSWPAIVGPASPRSAWMSLTASLKSGRHISDLLGVLADGRSGELADRAGRGVAGIIKPMIIN